MRTQKEETNQPKTIADAVTDEHISTTIHDLLEDKGGHVCSIQPDASVYEALEMMAKEQVGALVVIAEGRVAGVFSERDYARKVMLSGKSSKETQVSQVMSTKVSYIKPTQTVTEAMELMTNRKIRHLPVMVAHDLVGVISIGDLVKAALQDQGVVIEQLQNYIEGSYPV